MTRRDFLKAVGGGSTLLSFAPVVPRFLAQAARAAEQPRDNCDTVLVVVQLSGGNDGLNTIVPYADGAYAINRPTLRQPASAVHKIDSYLGFHPRMGACMRLHQEGWLSIVQGVGYANQDRSHDGAMRIWHTADARRSVLQTGWLGRAIDHVRRPFDACVPAVFVGRIPLPFSLNAENTIVPTIDSATDLVLRQLPLNAGADRRLESDRSADSVRRETDNPFYEAIERCAARAWRDSRQIESVVSGSVSRTAYPPFQLANDLRAVAQLIRAEIGARIYFTELGGGGIGGFDNHANQLGNHCALLHQLSESVAAFVTDLKRDHLLERVLLLTFSEFGRTVRENGRRGTDHGAAAPVFLVGGKVKGGLIGGHPSLSDLDNNALRQHTDFRRLYATVLDCWLGLDSRAALGGQFAPLEILKV